MIRLYYDAEEIKELDVLYIDILEALSLSSSYGVIDRVVYNSNDDYVTTNNDTDIANYFKLSYIGSDGGEIAISSPIISEEITTLIDSVRQEIGDTNLGAPAFSDEEIISKFRSAAKKHSNKRNLSTVRDDEWSLVMILVRIDCAFALAYDNARFYRLQLPGGLEIDKGDRSEHYLNVAKGLQRYYNDLMNRNVLNDDGYVSNLPKIEVSTCSVQSVQTGEWVKSYSDYYDPYGTGTTTFEDRISGE